MQVYQAAASGLQNDQIINNAIGAILFTINANSISAAGLRNLGISVGFGTSASGLVTLAWPTATAAIGGTVTATYGQFGTDTARPPIVFVQGMPGATTAGSAANMGFAWVNNVNTAGATLQCALGIIATGAAAAVSIGSASAAVAFAVQVRPAAQMSGINAFTYTFATS